MTSNSPSCARWLRSLLAIAFGGATLLHGHDVLADEEGKAGRVVRLTLNTQGSDKYASFHGSIAVKRSGAAAELYFWGGSTCPHSDSTSRRSRCLPPLSTTAAAR